MARIVTINPLAPSESEDHVLEFHRTTDKKSINLETVRSIASKYISKTLLCGCGYMRITTTKVGSRTFHCRTPYEDDPVYLITFEYKNRCGREDFYVEETEYERLKADLARHGWYI